MTTPGTILIVDDEDNLRKTLGLILQRGGYSVTMAGGGREALEYLQAGAYDLVFLDLRMPEMDGLSLLTEIRKNYTEMPIILLTAHATLDSAIEAMRHGANDYLLKPIDAPQILERVDHVLRNYHQPKRRREIFSEMQNLLSELHGMEAATGVEGELHPDTAPADPARFMQRGPFLLDMHTRKATFNNAAVELTPTSFDFLATLLRHSPNAVSYVTLVAESQGYQPGNLEAQEISRWRIHELRKAIEEDTRRPKVIITVRGVGYRLVTGG